MGAQNFLDVSHLAPKIEVSPLFRQLNMMLKGLKCKFNYTTKFHAEGGGGALTEIRDALHDVLR